MSQCIFSRQARLDLLEIREYVGKDSPEAAQRLVDTFDEKFRLLVRFPELGERCDNLAARLRCLSVGAYAIFYRVDADGIEIVRVIRGARDIEALFQRGP
jgi:toxin ParE1/3/4